MTWRSPRRQPRSDESRTKILEAAISLIGEVGPFGLTLALVGERADVSRALPTYQFHTRQELLAVAASTVLQADVQDQELGLEPLLAWMQHELEAAAAGAPELRARVSLVMGPSDHNTRSAVAMHWSESSGRIQRHLERGQVLQQVRTDLDAGAAATALLGQLYGEMARVAREVGLANADVFLALTRAAIAPTGTRPGVRLPDAPPRSSPSSPSEPMFQRIEEGAERRPDVSRVVPGGQQEVPPTSPRGPGKVRQKSPRTPERKREERHFLTCRDTFYGRS